MGKQGVDWRKASYSNGSGDCVEAGVAETGRVLVRDTTNREGGTLAFTADAWGVFLGTLR